MLSYESKMERLVGSEMCIRDRSLHGFVDIEVRGGFAMAAPIDVSFDTLVDSLDAALVALGEQ